MHCSIFVSQYPPESISQRMTFQLFAWIVMEENFPLLLMRYFLDATLILADTCPLSLIFFPQQ